MMLLQLEHLADTRGTPTDAHRQAPVCAREAHVQQPGGWAAGSLLQAALLPVTSLLQFFQQAASDLPFHVPHCVHFAGSTSSVASQLLLPACILGTILYVAFTLASLCDILYPMYISHPLFSMCPIMLYLSPCIFFPLNTV